MTVRWRSLKPESKGGRQAKRFNNKRVEHDGYTFDSKAEMHRYCELRLLQLAGEISNLQVHPKFDLSVNGRPILTRSDGYPNGRKVHCTWDFGYLKPGAGVVYEDVKSPASNTQVYRLRRALFEALYYPAQVVEVMA